VEIGPALSHPLGTATLSASLLFQADSTLSTYAQRGFVPATILGAKGMPIEAKRIEMERWWDRFLRGWSDVVAKIFNAETLTVQRVGAGLEELKGVYEEINQQQIENIGAAFGIPAGLFTSDSAFASEMDILMRAWYDTSEFQAIYQTIEGVMTDQLLKPWEYRWQFKPETLDIYQVDENERATAFSTYVSAGMKLSVVAEMLGLELPEGVEFENLDEAAKEKQEQERMLAEAQANKLNAANGAPEDEKKPAKESKPPAKTLTVDEIKDLNLWRQTAVRQFRKGHSPAIDWECKALPDDMADQIRARLKAAADEDAVSGAFELDTSTLTPAPEYRSDAAILALAESINKAVSSETRAEQPVVINLAAHITPADQPVTFSPVIKASDIVFPEAGPAPVVNVNVAPTPVTVSVPAAEVTVNNEVNMPRVRKEKQKVQRDPKSQLLTGSETTYEYDE
jgi:hypothetical protein